MSLLKKGADTGKVDSKGNQILAGDKIRKIGFNTLYIVNKYGGLSDETNIPLLASKNWRGLDYTIVMDTDSPEEIDEQKGVDAVNAIRVEEMSYSESKSLIKGLREELAKAKKEHELKCLELSQASDCVKDLESENRVLKDELSGAELSNSSLSEALKRLTEERDAALKAQVAAESKPLAAYTTSELMEEVKSRGREFLKYTTNDELKAELAERGFKGQMVREYTVTKQEVMDI